MSARAFLLGQLVLALSAATAWSNVLVVAPTGAPYTTVQAAVNAAVDGDVVLVHAGTYPGFTVRHKGLSIVADPPGSVLIESSLELNYIDAGQRASLSGFNVYTGCLFAGNSAGSVRLEGITSVPQPTSFLNVYHGLYVGGCADVAVSNCSLIGADHPYQHQGSLGIGVYAVNSNVAIYDSVLRGGLGDNAFFAGTFYFPPTRGGSGCTVGGSSAVFLAGCTIEGGTGGNGISGGTGQPGGDGLVVQSPAVVYSLDNVFVGGPGGTGAFTGAPTSGVVNAVPGTKRLLSCPSHIRESNTLSLGLQGQPGDLVWLNVGQSAHWSLDVPFGGVRLVGMGSRRLFVGTVPGSGVLNVGLPFGDLGPGIQSKTFQIQAFFRDVSGGSHHGSGAVVVVLDSAF